MRKATLKRTTSETNISAGVKIDGKGKAIIDTGCGFLNHMLTLFAAHGLFDIEIKCKGDTDVDYHHTAEDIGIALGEAFAKALGDKSGIRRYGNIVLPMDEALALVAVDISGRSCIVFNADIPAQKVGDFDTELCEEFLTAFSRAMNITLHVKLFYGNNSHHIIEAIFKGLGHALREACEIDERLKGKVPSTKGVI